MIILEFLCCNSLYNEALLGSYPEGISTSKTAMFECKPRPAYDMQGVTVAMAHWLIDDTGATSTSNLNASVLAR